MIADQAARLNKLVQLQLDIARLQTGQLHIERVLMDVGALVRRVVEETLPTVTTHTIAYTSPATPLLVEGDELRLDQVLQNLLQNAMKYSPPGSTVYVGIEQHDTTVCVTVRDEGIGIPQADLPHLFQRFYRASNVDEHQIIGLGVGLYVVKERVTLHNGTVEVASEEGRGSTFTICLPLARNAPGANPDTMMPEQ